MSNEAQPASDSIEQSIAEFIRSELLGPDVPVDRDTDLLAEGMLDSLGVMRLATWVDEEFRLEMQPADFVIDNFRTVAALATYVRVTRATASESP